MGMLLIALLFVLIHFSFGEIESVLLVNGQHNLFLDYFFKNLTRLGEWLGILICLLVIVLQKSWIKLIPLAFLNLLAGGLSYSLKHWVFPQAFRPRKILGNDELIHFIEGVSVNMDFSYPSGHTLTLMACACFLAWFYRSNYWAHVGLILFASLGALSRVYLFQHFFIDVATSICLGLFVFGLILLAFDKYLIDKVKKYE